MKKIINYIKEHWIFSLIIIIVTVFTFVDISKEFLKGQSAILAFVKSSYAQSVYYYSQKIEISRFILAIPWVLTIALLAVFIKHYLKSTKDHIDIPIYYVGKKLTVRFYHKGHSKEDATGIVICGDCKVKFENIERWGDKSCPRCGLGYHKSNIEHIIAEARSKWIIGRKQKGYIKTGKK